MCPSFGGTDIYHSYPFEKKGKLDENHRKAVQQVLHDLHDGFFVMNGVKYNLIPNSLENTEAELVMSNIYKDTFGIENESLQEVLDQGEQFFVDQIEMKLHAPVNRIYDVALLKDNGKHTLISFGSVKTGDYCSENAFTEISTNEKGEVYCMKGNRELFQIGVYVDVSGPEANDLYIDNKKLDNFFDKISNKMSIAQISLSKWPTSATVRPRSGVIKSLYLRSAVR